MEEEFPNYRKYRKKTSSTGPEWVSRREMEAEMATERQDVFGASILEDLHFIELFSGINDYDKERSYDKYIDKRKARVEENLPGIEFALQRLAKNRPNSLNNFFEDYLRKTDLKKIEKTLSPEERKFLTGMVMLAMLKNEKEYDPKPGFGQILIDRYKKGENPLNNEQLIKAIKIHHQNFLKNEAELNEKMQEYRSKASTLILEACHNGQIPLSPEVVSERLESLSFKAVDEMVSSLEHIGGMYNPRGHVIKIATDLSPEKAWPVFVHEVLHALSAQLEYLLTTEDDEEDYYDEYTIPAGMTIRTGLLFYDPDKAIMDETGNVRPRFRWLNEAVTEKITGELVEKNQSYELERKLLGVLLEKGLDEDVLRQAYFENYNLDAAKGEHRLPKTKKLFEITNELFGPRFLVRLDNYIYLKGVDSALKKWEEVGDEFPKFLEEEEY